MSEKVIAEAFNIKLVEKPLEEKKVHKGGFFTLRAANLIDPIDVHRYNTYQYTLLKSQGLIFGFALFWAHLIDKGSFLKPTQSKIVFYAAMVGVPSMVQAFYSSKKISGFVRDMDIKYSPQYEKYYVENLRAHSENPVLENKI